MNESRFSAFAYPLLLLLACFALGGCGPARTVLRDPTPHPVAQADDVAIVSAIKARMQSEADISAAHINIASNQGVVTLQGRVAREQTRTKAEQLARATAGVTRVVNLIVVGD